MDALKDVGVFFLTGLIGLIAYFMRAMKEESDKKISALFVHMDKLRDQIAELRERLAKVEK